MSLNGVCRTLFLIVFLSLVSACLGDTNIVVNPGFENGIKGWEGRSCMIAPAAVAHSGSGSVKASDRAAGWQGVKQSVFEKMADGQTYKISGWVRLDNAARDSVSLSIEQQDGGGTNYHNVATAFVVTDSEWTLVSGTFTLEVTDTLSVLDVYFEGPKPGVNFYVDDVNVYGPEFVAPEVIPIEPNAAGEIDAGKRHQKIEGFGAAGAHYTMEFVNHQKKAELYNFLFKELGLDIFRIRNTYDMEPKSFSETVEIVKGAKAALGDGLKIMISSWSPPGRLKAYGITVGGTLAKSDGKYPYDEFAQWWADSLEAYAKAGVKADYINIQNEPDYEARWDSCRFSPSEDSSYAGYDAAFEAVWQKLNAEMGPAMPKMLAPEAYSINMAGEYIDNLEDLSHVYGYAHHLYGCSGCAKAPDRYIPEMEKLKSKYGNKPLFQTEFEDEPDTWKDAMNMAVLIHNSMTAENTAGYLYWDLFWGPTSGMVSIDDPTTYIVKPVYYAFKQYSAFIHSDWQRVEAANDNPGLKLSAYISPDNSKLTAVMVNNTDNTDITFTFSLKDFSASKGEIYRSSKSEKCVNIGDYKAGEALKLPANSITTLVLSGK